MRTLVTFCVGVLLASLAVCSWTNERLKGYEAQAKARQSLLQDSLARTILAVRTDSVEVTKYVTRTKTLRDSVLLRLTDTLQVERYVYQTDTLRLSCLACVASAARLKVYSDSLIRFQDSLLKARRPSWKQRFGISCGFSLVKLGPDVKAGPSCGATMRLFP